MSEFPETVAGIAMSPQAAQALREGTAALADLLGWDPPELPAEEIPTIIDPRMQPGDVALYGPEQWRQRCNDQARWHSITGAVREAPSD